MNLFYATWLVPWPILHPFFCQASLTQRLGFLLSTRSVNKGLLNCRIAEDTLIDGLADFSSLLGRR